MRPKPTPWLASLVVTVTASCASIQHTPRVTPGAIGPAGVAVSPMPGGSFQLGTEEELFALHASTDTGSFQVDRCKEDQGGCGLLGTALMKGELGLPVDRRLGITAMVVSCDTGDAYGCDWAAGAFEDGKQVPKDLPRAMGFYRRGCELGFLSSCPKFRWLADPAGREEADTIVERMCSAGNKDACDYVQTAKPPGGRPLTPGTEEWALYSRCTTFSHCYSQKHCREKREDCHDLADLFATGKEEMPKDIDLASKLYARSCTPTNTSWCGDAAKVYPEGSPQRLLQLKHACAMGDLYSCDRRKYSSATDQREADVTLEELCSKGNPKACSEHGEDRFVSQVFTSKVECRAVILKEHDFCGEDRDCTALVLKSAPLCHTWDCRAIFAKDASLCGSNDCKAMLGKQADFCETANCKALITGNKELCGPGGAPSRLR